MHRTGKIDFDDLNFNKPNSYSPIKAYSRSKLANVLFTRELAKRLKDTNVKTYSLHPGIVATELTRHANEGNACVAFANKILSVIQISPFLGAQTTLYCVLEEKIESDSGSYYSNCIKKTLYKDACDDEIAKKLWDVSCDLVGMPDAK
jgi:short-subunit dehydrogenase involved in D-alanine esterification of teichoic acids